MPPPEARPALRHGVLLAVAAVYLWLARDGITSGYFPDEMMNLYGYWQNGWNRIFALSGSYRPAGALFYLPLFEIFGLNPLPGRLVCFALLLGNGALLYRLTRAWTGSSPAAVYAVVLGGYHAYFTDLYHSSATIYDLLAYAFCFGALLYYASRELMGPRQWGVWFLLWVGALGSKELAVVLPGVTLVYELTRRRDRRRMLVLLGAGLLAALVYLYPKLQGGQGMLGNRAYAVDFGVVMERLAMYAGYLTYQGQPLSHRMLATGAVALGAALLFTRSRAMAAALALAALFAAPLLVIDPRSYYAMYLAHSGLAMAAGIAIHHLSKGLRPDLAVPLISAALLLVLVPHHLRLRPHADVWMQGSAGLVATTVSQFQKQLPALPKGAKVLFLDDPLPADDHFLTFTLRLLYRDKDLQVDRAQRGPVEGAHDATVRYAGWRLTVQH